MVGPSRNKETFHPNEVVGRSPLAVPSLGHQCDFDTSGGFALTFMSVRIQPVDRDANHAIEIRQECGLHVCFRATARLNDDALAGERLSFVAVSIRRNSTFVAPLFIVRAVLEPEPESQANSTGTTVLGSSDALGWVGFMNSYLVIGACH